MSDPGPPEDAPQSGNPGPGIEADPPAYELAHPTGDVNPSAFGPGYTVQSPFAAGYSQPSVSPPPPVYTQTPGYGQPFQQPVGPYTGPYVPGYPPPLPQRPPRPSPFAGVSRSDGALDGAAVVALVATLVLPWTAAGRGYSRPEVIVGVVLGLCALLLPYLSRMGLFGPSWTPAKLRMTKLVVAAPLALCTATYFVLDAVLGGIDGGVTEYAPAPGAWIAAAAAVLAALPRRADLIDAEAPRNARLWATLLSALCVALVLCAAIALVLVVVNTYRSLSAIVELRGLVILPTIETVLFGVWIIAVWRVARQAAKGGTAARLVLGAAGAGALLWAVIAAFGSFTFGAVESLHVPFGGFTLTMAAALVALSPSLAASDVRADPQTWLAAVRGVFGLVLVADIILLVQVVVDVTLTGALTTVVFTTAGCAGVGAMAVDWARQQIAVEPMRSRTPVLIAAAAQAVAGLALFLVIKLTEHAWEAVTSPQVIAVVALSASAAAFVTVPKSMRSFFPRPIPAPPISQPGWPATMPPQPMSPTIPTAPMDPSSVAANPSTPPEVLYALAQQNPGVWPSLAANPATPRDLLALIAQSPDPAVQAALRARQP